MSRLEDVLSPGQEDTGHSNVRALLGFSLNVLKWVQGLEFGGFRAFKRSGLGWFRVKGCFKV